MKLLSLFGGLIPKHEHHFQHLWSDDHAEIDENEPIRHTAFSLLACEDCRRVEAFPVENYNLTTERYKEGLKKVLAEKQWRME